MAEENGLGFPPDHVRHAYKYSVLSRAAAQEVVYMILEGSHLCSREEDHFSSTQRQDSRSLWKFQVIADPDSDRSYIGAEYPELIARRKVASLLIPQVDFSVNARNLASAIDQNSRVEYSI
jgi:hypothetical protein